MRLLPERPNLDQLRRQARELQRRSKPLTLSAAQLALAREYGFPSWARLKGRGRTTGYAQMLLVWERFGYPDFMTAGADDLIGRQYADRPHLRLILDLKRAYDENA